jgi:3-keto-disaccharide hydrolase
MRISRRSLALLTLCLGVLPIAAQSEPPPRSGQTMSLFDGRTLAGWEGNPNVWRVENGALTGGMPNAAQPRNEFLASTREFSDFVLRFQIKLTGTEGFVNSGMQIRSQRKPDSSEMIGYQCDYGDPDWWGGIYDESRRDKVLAASNMAALGPAIHRGDWNDYVIRADGPRITTWINNVMGVDYRETDPSIPLSGKLGIQLHSGGKAVVQVRNITIEEMRR